MATIKQAAPRRHRLAVDEWQYLRLKIWSEEPLNVDITEISFRMTIYHALQQTFGIAGVSTVIDILDWDDKAHVGIIKIPSSAMTTVYGAIATYQFSMANQPCILDILGSSSHLISLADDSRELSF